MSTPSEDTPGNKPPEADAKTAGDSGAVVPGDTDVGLTPSGATGTSSVKTGATTAAAVTDAGTSDAGTSDAGTSDAQPAAISTPTTARRRALRAARERLQTLAGEASADAAMQALRGRALSGWQWRHEDDAPAAGDGGANAAAGDGGQNTGDRPGATAGGTAATPGAEALGPPAAATAGAMPGPEGGAGIETDPSAEDELPDQGVDLTAAAFFDVDNTLIQGASIILFARGLARHKYFSTLDLVGFGWKQIKFRVLGRENAGDVAAGREKALSFVKGRDVDELVRLSEEIFDEAMLDRIWPGTRALAQMHLDAGQQVWLVTATPVQLAQVIAQRLGLTGALGTVAETRDGKFTGRLVGDLLHGLGKAHAVRTLAIAHGLNLRRCTAYSDSHNDVPMLSLVGTAVAINPDAQLREVARARGWEIRDFRSVRRAAQIGVPTALAAGALGGAAAALLSDRGAAALGRNWERLRRRR